MAPVSMIAIDLAKNVFHLHAVCAGGGMVLRKNLRRGQFLDSIAGQLRCCIAMEACATAHWWARQVLEMVHSVRLVASSYRKPFLKRQKNDMADAEVVAEAASRPSMRFVAVKSEAQQERAMNFRTRDMLARQRTRTIDARGGHPAEHGGRRAAGETPPEAAGAIESFAPELRTFRCGRDFSARLGLPRQHSTGGKRSAAGCRRWGSVISVGS